MGDALRKRVFTFSQNGRSRSPEYALIALLSGARINEICQLRTQDILEIDGVLSFRITGMASERTKAALAQKKERAAAKGEPHGLGNPDMKKMRLNVPANFQKLGSNARTMKVQERRLKLLLRWTPSVGQPEGAVKL